MHARTARTHMPHSARTPCRLNDAAGAEAACRAALALDPAYLKAKHRLGDALRRLGKLPEVGGSACACVLACAFVYLCVPDVCVCACAFWA